MYKVQIYSGDDYSDKLSNYEYEEIEDAYKKANEIRKIATSTTTNITCIKIQKDLHLLWSWYYDIDDEECESYETDNSDDDKNKLVNAYNLYKLSLSFSNVQKIYNEFRYEGYDEIKSNECEERLIHELDKWANEHRKEILSLINLETHNTKWCVLEYFHDTFKDIENKFNKHIEEYIKEHNIIRDGQSNNEIMNKLI